MKRELIKIEKNTAHSLKLYFSNGEKRLFDINSIYNSDLPYNVKKRWELMVANGKLFTAEISLGDIVWPGWCELFSEDFDTFTKEIK